MNYIPRALEDRLRKYEKTYKGLLVTGPRQVGNIIPEVLYPYLPQSNILYINLYVDSKEALWNRLKLRNPKKYIPECIPYLYQANIDLHNSLNCIPRDLGISYSINVSALSVQETLSEINKIFVEFNQNN